MRVSSRINVLLAIAFTLSWGQFARAGETLDQLLRSQIAQQIGKVLNKEVRLRESVDPNLIGGMVVRVGDTVFDNSVANRMDKVARRARDGFSSQLLQKFSQFTTE